MERCSCLYCTDIGYYLHEDHSMGQTVVWLSNSYVKSFWRMSCFFHKGQSSESLVKHPARLLLYSNCSYRTTDTGYSAGEMWSFLAVATKKKYGKAVWMSAHEDCLLRHCRSPNMHESEMLPTSPLAWTTNSVWPSFSSVPNLAKPALQLEALLAQFQHLCLAHDSPNIHGAQRAVTYSTWMHSRSWHDRYNMNRIHKMFRWLKFYKVCCFVFLCLGCLYIF